MRLLVVVIALVAACAANVDPNNAQELQDLLNSLKAGDEEGLLKSTDAETKKEYMANLKKSVISVNDHNDNDGEDYQQGYNEFSYMSDDQKVSHLGLNISDLIMAKREFLEMERLTKRDVLDFVARQDDTVDYTAKLPAIKNQGSCGSCWTFGAAAAFEYQLNRNYDDNKAISEEQLLDCTYPTRDGCNGGWPADCYTWMKNAGTNKAANYVASMKEYPYQGSDGACKITTTNQMAGFTISGTKYIQNEADVYAAVGKPEIGVLSVAIAVINSFYSFKSGVYYDASCATAGINHAVDIVGYGVLNSVNYWNVRNSWGSSWGDKGYIRMRRGDNLCSIAKYAHYPVMSGKREDEPTPKPTDAPKPTDGSDEEDCTWKEIPNTKLKGGLGKPILSMTEAYAKCLETENCAGVSCKNKKKCQMNKKAKGKENEKFTAYKLICKKS